jgi:hypothetical protein
MAVEAGVAPPDLCIDGELPVIQDWIAGMTRLYSARKACTAL